MYLRTQAAIDLDALEYNVEHIREKLPDGVKLLFVIKADAYGHGAVTLAQELEEKCDFFGVACVDEAMELIDAGIETPLLVLGWVAPEEYPEVVRHGIRIPIFSMEDAEALSAEAVAQNRAALFHFCVDTGMSRIGFQVTEESADICKKITELDGIEAEGLFSHFATADEHDLSKARQQQQLFRDFAAMLEARGVSIPIKHINNSAGIMNFADCFDMCRSGIITYGLYPSDEVNHELLDIRPVMTWKTHISYVKTLPAGREISYGGTFVTERDTVVATIPVGYADGYPRCLSNKGDVLIGGRCAPIIGRVCMDQFMVDVTDLPQDSVYVGAEVVLVGEQTAEDGETVCLSMEYVSDLAHSFNYELPCRISRRVPRVYYKNGRIIKVIKNL